MLGEIQSWMFQALTMAWFGFVQKTKFRFLNLVGISQKLVSPWGDAEEQGLGNQGE